MSEKQNDQDTVKAVQDFKQEFANFQAKSKETLEAVEASAKASGKEAATAIKTAEEAAKAAKASADLLSELEQQVAGFVEAEGRAPQGQTIGEIVVASQEYKALGLKPSDIARDGTKIRVEASANSLLDAQANTLSGQTGTPPDSSNILVPAQRRAGVVTGAWRSLRIVDLLNTIPVSSNAWEFTKESVWTSAAAETAEKAAKPESSLAFTLESVSIRTIAHFIKASNQILADAPALRAYIDARMIYGVNYRLDAQLLNGDGSGQNIAGMTKSGNFTAFTPTSGDTAIDSINRAKYALMGADYEADGIIMNPADWGAIERLKTTPGEYVVGNPFGAIVPMLWGLPIVLTNAMTSGKFMMADFAMSYDHLARQGMAVDLGYVNDDFTKNLVTIRAERRDALATLKTASTRYGDLTT